MNCAIANDGLHEQPLKMMTSSRNEIARDRLANVRIAVFF